MSFDDLTNDNIMMYAVKAYDKPNCIMSEFKEDMKRFNYLKRLFKRYRKLGELREQLVINHLVVLNNVFGPEVATRMLFFKMSKDDKIKHVDLLQKLLNKQQILYTRLSLSDDPEAKNMKKKIAESAAMMGLEKDVDMNVIFSNMSKLIDVMREQIDKNDPKG